MKVKVGVNVPGGTGLDKLDGALERITGDGFDAAELNLSSCPLIIGGRLMEPVLNYMKQVLKKYPLVYTAHAGYGMDLRNLEDRDLQHAVLFASIDACAALNLNPLNIHYEEYSRKKPEEDAFFRQVREAADYAEQKKVRINIENIEVEHYRYALDAVKKLSHPNVGMTLDLGHLFISSRYFGYDYLEAVKECAPFVRHLHINDNNGVFEPMRLSNMQLYNTLDKGYRFAFSRGDIHIPPFWGDAPLKEAFTILKEADYKGIWLCEYYSHLFHPLNADILKRVRKEIKEA